MANKQTLVIANFKTGYETDLPPFLINNDAFPVLNNMYIWRGRAKKKRGTSLLGRLQRSATATSISGTSPISLNLYTYLSIPEDNPTIVPGSISITLGPETYTDNGDGTLRGSPTGHATVNYITGDIIITTAQGPGNPLTITLEYNPNLPVMGLEDFQVGGRINFPDLVAFDTTYSYQFDQTSASFYDVTFYKGSGLPFTWDGTDFQQFWSTNYSNAMWVTNGVPGFHFATITALVNIAASTTATVTLDNANLVVGDRITFNEVVAASQNINGITGTVTNAASAPTYTVTLDTAVTVTTFASGIVLLLTNSRPSTGNGIKFYDGDPTTSINLGWVNFNPPLSNATTPQYLIGADAVVPFKNRLLFFGPTIATSSAPGGIYYRNRVVYSENGTPYYNSLVPLNQVFEFRAWFQNIAGFGGFLGAPIPQKIVTIEENEDVLLTGFESKQLKLLFTGDDSLPFVFQTINSELGSQSTFSGVSLDTGALTIGDYGIALTTQVSAQRIDLVIPDQVFDISGINNADRRVTAIRDYRNEFIYFSYSPDNRPNSLFNSKTLLYNYRDNTWATFDENYTHYGTFRRTSNITWSTLNTVYKTWNAWTDPWNFGGTSARYPNIIGGNQQGFVMIKNDTTREDNSQYVEAIDTNTLIVTSPNHCLNSNDFIEISGAIGVTNLNNEVFKIFVNTSDTFTLLLSGEQMQTPPTGTYLGGGVYRRMSNIFVQTKQFQIAWESARKTRIGTQRFLIENAPNDDDGDPPSQITLNIYTSQNTNFPSNLNQYGYLPFSNILLTGPEPNQPFQIVQDQIWHRSSNSLIGDTVQLGFSLSDEQMRVNSINQSEIIIYAIAIDLYPGPILV